MMYSVVVHNFTLLPRQVECLLEGNDVIAPGAPRWIPIYREDVQRRDKGRSRWFTVRAMNFKEPLPFKKDVMTLLPGSSIETSETAYGVMDVLNHGDSVRIVIHQALYHEESAFASPSFEITDDRVDEGVPYRIRH
jgi:hypothetical protein